METIETCSFTFVSIRTNLPIRVFGIERTWEYLKEEFDRHSDGLTNAKYYETKGPGPLLFAAVNNQVYYHDQEKWYPYGSATDIEFGIINIDE